jgi:hypothetical protein
VSSIRLADDTTSASATSGSAGPLACSFTLPFVPLTQRQACEPFQ